MNKIMYVILMESNCNNYSIGDFATREDAENYIESKNLNIYSYLPIIVKKMAE